MPLISMDHYLPVTEDMSDSEYEATVNYIKRLHKSAPELLAMLEKLIKAFDDEQERGIKVKRSCINEARKLIEEIK